MQNLLWLSLAGVLGTLSRYGLGEAAARWWGTSFPWGTWLINCSGCFLFALIWGLAERRQWVGPEFRFYALTGFMGAYTTYSTYMFEIGRLVDQGRLARAAADFAGQNALAFVLVLAGLALARAL